MKKRGELDDLCDLVNFGEKLETATVRTIENGYMTGDLAAISKLDNIRRLDTEEFLHAVAETLEDLLGTDDII